MVGLALGARKSRAPGTGKFAAEFQKACDLLASTRPTAVNLFWAIDRMKRTFATSAQAGASVDEIKARLDAEARCIHDEDVEMCRAIGRHGYDVVKAKRPITIRDLMTHTSGISYGMGPAADEWKKAGIQGWYFADRNEPIATTVSRMASLPFDSQPGEKWVYGYNIDVLGAVIEKVSGMPMMSMNTDTSEPLVGISPCSTLTV